MALCDTVLRLAERELFRIVLSEAVLEEARRNLIADGRCNDEQARWRIAKIKNFFDSSIVTGYEQLESGMTCDPGDRHVLAAAIAGGANQIVTSNIRHFPQESTTPYNIEVVTPDIFLQNVFDLHPEVTVEEVRNQAASLRNPPHTIYDVLRALSLTAPNFAQSVITEIARQDGGFGRVGAAVAVELATVALMKARAAEKVAYIENDVLTVDGKTALVFARNAGLFRLQTAVDRLNAEKLRALRKIVVLGARPLEEDIATLAGHEIGMAWAIRWDPVVAFDGADSTRQFAPWLFS